MSEHRVISVLKLNVAASGRLVSFSEVDDGFGYAFTVRFFLAVFLLVEDYVQLVGMRPYARATVALGFAAGILVLLVGFFVLKNIFLLACVANVFVQVFNLLYEEELVFLC